MATELFLMTSRQYAIRKAHFSLKTCNLALTVFEELVLGIILILLINNIILSMITNKQIAGSM